MNLRALFVLAIGGLGAAVTAPSQAATPPTYEGLVSVRSWNLDELYLRPNADLASYRKVVIDPVQVRFREDWNRDFVDHTPRLAGSCKRTFGASPTTRPLPCKAP